MTDSIARFPQTKGVNLEGDEFELPKDLKGNLKIVVVAFKRQQTEMLESWGLPLDDFVNQNPEVEYYELPVLSAAYSPIRWWIDGGMKAGIVDSKARQRTLTLYTNKQKFKRSLGIPDEETIYVFLLDNEGNVLAQSNGSYAKEKLDQLQAAITVAAKKEK
jgi:hypothetical protein